MLEVGIEAVRRASGVCRAVQAALVTSDSLAKKDKSPVTVADFAAQAIVSHTLLQAFPSIPLVGEEDASALRENPELSAKVIRAVQSVLPELSATEILAAIDRGTYEGGASGRHWVLDPIDGTKGFLRGDQYAIALALVEGGVVTHGVLGCPNLDYNAAHKGCIFYAALGCGATAVALDAELSMNISVQQVDSLAEASICESVEKAHTSHSHSFQIAERLGITAEPYRIDSQCKYAAVARGDAAIYLRLPTKPGYVERVWDHAAGLRVIEAAGGTVTDVYGEPLDFSLGRGLERNKGVIVTNGQYHSQVLEAVRAVLGL